MVYPDFEQHFEDEIPFVGDGFVTGSIVLPGLGLNLDLPPDRYFKFDGIVTDMWAYLRSLSWGMQEYLGKYIGNPRFRTAFNMGFVWYDHIGMFMAVKEVSPRVDLSNIAHESAEIAFRLGYVQELEDHLQLLGLQGSLKGLSNHEVGLLAGILVPECQGYQIRGLVKEQDPITYTRLVEQALLK